MNFEVTTAKHRNRSQENSFNQQYEAAVMKLGILFSGGKDSCYATFKAMEESEVCCLITLVSKNSESYMFHTPTMELTALQAQAMDLPQIRQETPGQKEAELAELKTALGRAKEEYGIEGVVTGAIESVYQGTRVQKVCHELGLWCFNPLWKKDQALLLEELVAEGFKVVITGIFAYPLEEDWLGRTLDRKMISQLVELAERYEINPSGEGGELETTVLDAPFFREKIEILEAESSAKNHAGTMKIKKAQLVSKAGKKDRTREVKA